MACTEQNSYGYSLEWVSFNISEWFVAQLPNQMFCLVSLSRVNTVSGAQCLYTMFYCVFPSLKNVKNTMSSGSALSSAEYIFFFVFIILTGLMLLLDVRRWSILVYAKLVIFTFSAAGESFFLSRCLFLARTDLAFYRYDRTRSTLGWRSRSSRFFSLKNSRVRESVVDRSIHSHFGGKLFDFRK